MLPIHFSPSAKISAHRIPPNQFGPAGTLLRAEPEHSCAQFHLVGMKSYYQPGSRSSDQLKVSDQILDEKKRKCKKLFCNACLHFPARKLRTFKPGKSFLNVRFRTAAPLCGKQRRVKSC